MKIVLIKLWRKLQNDKHKTGGEEMKNKLETKVTEKEEERIKDKIKNLSKNEQLLYHEAYADGVAYSNKLTIEVYAKNL